MKRKIAFLALSLGLVSWGVRAQQQWTLVGDKEELENPVVFTQVDEAGTEFVYGGRLSTQSFRVSDGTNEYVHECGDNDPVGDSITLKVAEEGDLGLRVRYAGEKDFFKVTINVKGDAKSIKAEQIILPTGRLYLHGGPVNLGMNWEAQDAILLEQDLANASIFWYKGDLRYNELGSERGNIKLLRGRGWGENYHPDAVGNVALLDALNNPMKMRLNGDDNKWFIPSDRSGDGYYEIKVDMVNITIEVVKFEPNIVASEDILPRAIFACGTALPCGFPTDNKTPIQLNAVSEGVYSWAGMITAGELKFQKRRGSYMYAYMPLTNGQELVPGQEYPVEYVENYLNGSHPDNKFTVSEANAGINTLSIDLNTMTAWLGERPDVTKVETVEGTEVTCYSNDGKLYLSTPAVGEMQVRVFGVDGRLVAERSFESTTDIALPTGSYIVALAAQDGTQPTRLHAYVK